MALQIHQLPTTDTIPSGAFMILKREVSGDQLDYKVDITSLFAPYLNRNTEVGTGIGQFFQLEDVNGSPGLPTVDGSQLTNVLVDKSTDIKFGVSKLSDEINSTLNASTGETAATPLAVRNMGLTKLGITGGDVSGAIVLDNDVALQGRDTGNTPTDLIKYNTFNDIDIGHILTGDVSVRSTGSFRVKDGSYTDKLTVDTNTGNVNVLGTISIPENTNFNIGGKPVNFNAGTLSVGTVGNAASSIDLHTTSKIRIKDSVGTSVFEFEPSTGSVTGIGADTISFTPAIGLTSTNVQDVIEEVQSDVLAAVGAVDQSAINVQTSERYANDAAQSAASIAETMTTFPSYTLQFDIPNVVQTFIPSEQDDDPNWVHRCEHLSYWNETRPLGKQVAGGSYANDTAAIAAGGVAGDYYHKTNSGQFFEIGGSEIFRGGGNNFPQKPAFSIKFGRLYVWDTDGPEWTMWMIFDSATTDMLPGVGDIGAVSYKNGLLCLTSTSFNKGLYYIDFISDTAQRSWSGGHQIYDGGISQRNDALNYKAKSRFVIIATDVTKVLITHTSDAPLIDGQRDLTVYVGTEAGLSRIENIRSNPTVTDWTDTSGSNVNYVGYLAQAKDEIFALVDSGSNAKQFIPFKIGEDLVASDFSIVRKYIANEGVLSVVNLSPVNDDSANSKSLSKTRDGFVVGSNKGTAQVIHNQQDPSRSLNSKITDVSNTGYMAGNASVYGCGESSNIVESNLITNGGFDTDTTWTKGDGWAISGGSANASSGTASSITQNTVAVQGKVYKVTYTVSGRTQGTCFSKFVLDQGETRNTNGTFIDFIKLTTAANSFGIQKDSSFDGSIDDVSVVEVVPDYGALNTPMSVVNYILSTTSPSGDIYGFTDFGGSFGSPGYLEGDVNTDPDIKTGATYSIVFKHDLSARNMTLFGNQDGVSGTQTGFDVSIKSNSDIVLRYFDAANTEQTVIASGAYSQDDKLHSYVVRSSGQDLSLYFDGELVGFGAGGAGIAQPTDKIRIGVLNWTSGLIEPLYDGTVYLFKAIHDVMTPDEIKKMSEDDLLLLNEGATMTGNGLYVQVAHSTRSGLTALGQNNGGVDFFKDNIRIRSITSDALNIGTITSVEYSEGYFIASSATASKIIAEDRLLDGDPRKAIINRVHYLNVSHSLQTTFELSDGYKPSRVYVDGLLKREGSSNDYTVTHNGFNWVIIFAVAPGIVDVAVEEDLSNY